MRSTLVAAVLAAAFVPQPALSDTPDVMVHEHESSAAKDPAALPQKSVMLRSESKPEGKPSNPEEAEPCSWKEWGDWSRCSVSCGEGRWVRTRIWVGDNSCRMTDDRLARSMQSATCSVNCASGKESPVPATTAAAADGAKSSPKKKPCNNGRPNKTKAAKIDKIIESLAPSTSKAPNASRGKEADEPTTSKTPDASSNKEADEMVDDLKDVLTNKSKPTSNTSSDIVDAVIRENVDIISPSNKSQVPSKRIKEVLANTSSDTVDAVIRENVDIISPSNKSQAPTQRIKEALEDIISPSNADKILEAVIRENQSSTESDRPVKKVLDAIIGPMTSKSKPPSSASITAAADILDAVADASSGDSPIKTVEDVIRAINKSDRRFKTVLETTPAPSSTTVTTTPTTTQLIPTTTTKPQGSAPFFRPSAAASDVTTTAVPSAASDVTTTAVPSTTVTTTTENLEELARSLVVGDAAFEIARLTDSTISTVEAGIRSGLANMANVSNLCIASQTNVQESGNRETALYTSFSIDLLCANATNYHANCVQMDQEIEWMRGLPVEQLRDTVIHAIQQSISLLRAADIDGFSVTGFEARTADADTLSFFPRSQAQRDNRQRPKACEEASAGASPGGTADTFVLPDVSQLRNA